MNKFLKNTFFAASALLMLNSCVHDDDYDIPSVNCNNRWEATTDIPSIKALNDTAEPLEITTETIMEGYVVSSDETGNFYKSISLQDDPTNPTAGISLEVNMAKTYTRYPVGSRVLIDLQGLFIAKDRGTYKIGSTFLSDTIVRVGRMPEEVALAHVAKSCDDVVDIEPVSYTSIAEAMDESHLNTLIKLENVQFQTAGNGETYYQDEGAFGGAFNRSIVDSEGNTIDLRTSSYADFAAEILPDGSGSITAVISAYSNSNNVTPSTYQLFIRDISDVNLDQPRFEVVNGDGPVGGTSASYASCVMEDFEGFSAELVSFEEYINYAYNGDRYWTVKNYSGNNNYLQMSSYQSEATNDVYFIIPVDFDNADEFSFSYKMRYYNGDALKVYYSNDYNINGPITGLQEITSEFDLSNTDSDNFSSAGMYDLSGVSGNGAIFFKYEGMDGSVTSTIQLDDIRIADNDNDDCQNDGGGNDDGNDDGNGDDDDQNPPSGDAVSLFPGYDFENWSAFVGGLNSYGLKPYATQGIGMGYEGSASLHVATDATTTDNNDYVFTALASSDLPSSYSKISFYMMGNSTKSVSLNVYKTDGTYYKFNLGSLSESTTLSAAPSNQYTGTIDTSGEWILITLDLEGITDLNVSDTNEGLFALKIGKNADYDLHFDQFVIE